MAGSTLSSEEPWRIERDFVRVASERPDRTAIETATGDITFRELDDLSNRLAHRLMAAGIKRGEYVAVASETVSAFVIGALAALKIGAAYLPIDLRYSMSRAQAVLEDGAASILLSHTVLDPEIVPEGMPVIWSFDDPEALADYPKTQPSADSLADDPAYLCYTSGSTGKPKGVMVGHRGVEGLIYDQDFKPYSVHDRVAQTATFAFDVATLEVWGTLLHGGCLVSMPEDTIRSASKLGAFLKEKAVSSVWLTTSHFNAVITRNPAAFGFVHTVMIGGEAADADALAKMYRDGTAPSRLINGYGPTEATTLTTWHLITQTDAEAGIIPIGRPLSGREVSIRDEALQPVSSGSEGELVVSGPGTAYGYLGDEKLTIEKFVDDPTHKGRQLYKTGDLCRELPDGSYAYLGRIDEQVKIRGLRVELGGVAAVLSDQTGVEEAVVLARDRSFGSKEIVGFVRGSMPLDTQALRTAMAEDLQEFMVPASIFQVEAFPLKPSGKLDRAQLLNMATAQSSANNCEDGQPTETETMLLELWKKILQQEANGLTQEFGEIGGDSLSLMELVMELEDILDQVLSPQDLPASMTVASLASFIDAGGARPEKKQARAFLITSPWTANMLPAPFSEALGRGAPTWQLTVDRALFQSNGNGDLIEHMTNDLRDQVLSHSSTGPYAFAGYSFTGVLAYELARKLEAMGHNVDLLVLIDTFFGTPSAIERLRRFSGLTWQEKLSKLKARFKTEPSGSATVAAETDAIMRACQTALQTYEPGPYRGKTLLIRSSNRSFDRLGDWSPYLHGEVSVQHVKGSHLSLVNDEKNIHRVAVNIAQEMAKV